MNAISSDFAIVRRTHAPRIADVQAAVGRRCHVRLADLLSDARRREIARPRQVAMALAVRVTRRSTKEIGRAFNRDHSTVLHAQRAVDRLVLHDADLAQLISELEAELRSTCRCLACSEGMTAFPFDPPQLLLPIAWPGELPLLDEGVAA